MMKSYDHNGLAGCVSQRKNHRTKFIVGIYNAEQAGLDASCGPWATVCEEHHIIINHGSLALANAHAGHPNEWCDDCGAMDKDISLRTHMLNDIPAYKTILDDNDRNFIFNLAKAQGSEEDINAMKKIIKKLSNIDHRVIVFYRTEFRCILINWSNK